MAAKAIVRHWFPNCIIGDLRPAGNLVESLSPLGLGATGVLSLEPMVRLARGWCVLPEPARYAIPQGGTLFATALAFTTSHKQGVLRQDERPLVSQISRCRGDDAHTTSSIF